MGVEKSGKPRDAESSPYQLTDEEAAAIALARAGGLASDEEVAVFWKRHGIHERSQLGA